MNRKVAPQQRVQSVERGMAVLKNLAAAGSALSLSNLAKRSAMPASKAYRYLASLVASGMVEQDPVSGRYRLGPEALYLGLSALSQLDAVAIAAQALAELRNRTRQSCFLSVWGDGGPTILRWETSMLQVSVNVRVGSVLPLLTSATGRVFAAFGAAAVTESAIESELQQLASAPQPGAPCNRQQVAALLRSVRNHGLASVEGVLLAGIDAVSAPVTNHDGSLALALTIIGPSGALDVSRDGEVAPELLRSAAGVSCRLGAEAPMVEGAA